MTRSTTKISQPTPPTTATEKTEEDPVQVCFTCGVEDLHWSEMRYCDHCGNDFCHGCLAGDFGADHSYCHPCIVTDLLASLHPDDIRALVTELAGR